MWRGVSASSDFWKSRFWNTQRRRIDGLLSGRMHRVSRSHAVDDEIRVFVGVDSMVEAIVDVMMMPGFASSFVLVE